MTDEHHEEQSSAETTEAESREEESSEREWLRRELRVPIRMFAVLFGILTVVLMTVILNTLSSILKPMMISVFLCYLIFPGVHFLVRRGVPKVLAYVITLVAIFAGLYLFGQLVALNIQELSGNMPQYQRTLEGYIQQLNELAIRYKLILPDERLTIQDILGRLPSDFITEFIGGGTSIFFDLVGNLVTIIVFTIFFLYEAERLPRRIRMAFNGEHADRILQITRNISANVQHYILLKVFVSFVTAVIATIILAFMDLDLLYFVALIVFLLNFIPYLGSVLATLIPFTIALVQFDSPWYAVWLFFVLGGIQMTIGNILEPRLQGQKLNLSPLLILTALGFWGWLWGLPGMLLAIPITVSLHIVLEQFDSTRPIAIMMSGLEFDRIGDDT